MLFLLKNCWKLTCKKKLIFWPPQIIVDVSIKISSSIMLCILGELTGGGSMAAACWGVLDMWQVTGGTQYVATDMWHVTVDLMKKKNKKTLSVWGFQCFEDIFTNHHLFSYLNEVINHRGDCRTAPATPGLLDIEAKILINYNNKKIWNVKQYCRSSTICYFILY